MHLQLLCAQRGKDLVGGWKVAASNRIVESSLSTSQRLSVQSFAPSAVVWAELQCQIMPPRPIWSPPFREIRVDLWLEKVPVEMATPHAHLATIHNAADRVIGIGRNYECNYLLAITLD